MGTQFDRYYYDRAEAELEQAQRAEHPAAVRAHYTLAGYYLDMFYGAPEGSDARGTGQRAGEQTSSRPSQPAGQLPFSA